MDPTIKFWLIILAVATVVSVTLQISLLLTLFFGVQRVRGRLKEFLAASLTSPAAQEITAKARETLETLQHISKDLAEVADRMKVVAKEATEASRREIARADHVVGDVLTRVEKVSAEVESGIVRPVREIKALSAGVRTVLAVLFGKNGPNRSHHRPVFRAWFLIVVFLMAASSPALLQAQESEEQASYEGQKVAVVDLVARPSINVERLRSLIQQKTGEPYSIEKIQSSIEALQQTGLFVKIDRKVTPLATGLQVEFVLQPAFYIGIISFPGTEKNFEYSRLLQVVNYSPQELYDQDRIREAEAALQQFLVSSGYFLSTVRTETEFGEANQLAHLIFHVTLNQRAKFGTVKITGLPAEEAARVGNALHSFRARFKNAYIKSGKTYAPERLKSAVVFIRDTLNRMNRLAEDVRLEPPRYNPDTNRAEIIFQVTAGPAIEVRTEGARVSQGTLRRLVPIYEENSFDRDLVEEGERNLISHFQAKGYFNVRVNSEVEEESQAIYRAEHPKQATKIILIYQIETGDRHRVMEVSVQGNRYFDDEVLLTLVAVRPAGFLTRGRFSEDLVQKSAENLTHYYRDAGFPDTQVQPRVEDEESHLYVRFKITEGKQTLVNDFRIEGNDTQWIGTLAPEGLNLGPDKPYSQRLLNQDRDRIMATYLDLGYLDGAFESTVQPLSSDHEVDVVYKVEEGPQTLISDVVLAGAEHTQPWFIDRIIKIQERQPLSQGNLLAAESLLYEAGLFDWASVSPLRPITDQSKEKVLVKVHEAKKKTLTYGLGFEMSTRAASVPAGSVALPGSLLVTLPSTFKTTQRRFASPRGSIEYSRRNLRGEGETAAVAALVTRLDQRLSFSYANPYLLRSRWNWDSLLSLSGERTSENPIFTERLGEVSFQVERFLNIKRTMTLLFRYNFSRSTLSELLIPELVLPSDRAVRLSTFSASYVRDTRDKPLDAQRGIYQTLDFGINPKAIGSSANFVRLLGQTAYYRKIKPSLVWASNARLGIAKPFAESEVPVSKRFFSGGANSLRGFPFNGAGPQRIVPVCNDPNDPSTCANITVPMGGNAVFIINSEIRFPIPVKKGLGGVAFYDGGNVYERIGFKHFFNDYSNTVGIGLRYDTPVGPIRFDVGRNLQPLPGMKAYQYFVTIGQAF
ncbi:MAG: BamA/TamA family outer membrane protein [Acidobacteria bacterium]|nr:BamA/TamA family outer membrane protein [Acidobacteriota bacterium]